MTKSIMLRYGKILKKKEEVIDQSTPANNSLLTGVLQPRGPYWLEYTKTIYRFQPYLTLTRLI